MKLRNLLVATGLAVATLLAQSSFASTINFTFDTDKYGVVAAGENYIDVTISEVGDDVKFIVDVNTDYVTGGKKSGLKNFSFNVADGISDISVTGLPDSWIQVSENFDGTPYDYKVVTRNKKEVVSHLEFTVSGVDGDTVNSYNLGFGARFNKLATDSSVLNKVFFETLGVSPVPLPAAVWFFGSALLALLGFRRVQRQKSDKRASTPTAA